MLLSSPREGGISGAAALLRSTCADLGGSGAFLSLRLRDSIVPLLILTARSPRLHLSILNRQYLLHYLGLEFSLSRLFKVEQPIMTDRCLISHLASRLECMLWEEARLRSATLNPLANPLL